MYSMNQNPSFSMAFYRMSKLQFTSNLPLTPPVQSEASAAWAHRRRKQLPAAVARACRVPGAELWVTRRHRVEDAVWWDGMGCWFQNKYGFRCQWEPFLELGWNNGNIGVYNFCGYFPKKPCAKFGLVILHSGVVTQQLEFTKLLRPRFSFSTSPKDGLFNGTKSKGTRVETRDRNFRGSGGKFADASLF